MTRVSWLHLDPPPRRLRRDKLWLRFRPHFSGFRRQVFVANATGRR